jgi:predicted porin
MLPAVAFIGTAYADEVADLRSEAQTLRKQNEALAKRLAAIEKRQKDLESSERPVMNANAADLGARPVKAVPYAPVDDSLTWHGVTLYGVVDAGFGYDTHGAPFNGQFPPGTLYGVSKMSNRATWTAAPNGMTQSFIGLKGTTELLPGVKGIFKFETGFNPFSGQLANGPATLVQNAGIPLSLQSANGDSSRAGQAINGQGYVGLSSPVYGTLTVGRQNGLMVDNILAYDPAGGAYAFSLVGFSSVYAGGGTGQTARFDQSLKYVWNYGPVHAGLLYQVGNYGSGNTAAGAATGSTLWPHDALQANVGFTYQRFAVDATYSKTHGGVKFGALDASQVPPTYPTGTLSATVSDNQAFVATAKYKWDRFEVLGGYEWIQQVNPTNPAAIGFVDNGYLASKVNNIAFPNAAITQLAWIGGKWKATDNLTLIGSYYHVWQNSYGDGSITTGSKTGPVGCATAAFASCGGTQDWISFVGDYVFTKHFDVYAGVSYSQVNGGLANGYIQNSILNPATGTPKSAVSATNTPGWNGQNWANNLAPTIGARYAF